MGHGGDKGIHKGLKESGDVDERGNRCGRVIMDPTFG